MSIDELIFVVQALPRAEKLRLIQAIASQLEQEETNSLAMPAVAEVWSPYDAFDAAERLAQLLADAKGSER